MAVFSKGVLELQDNEYNDKIESLHWGTPNFDVVEDKGGRRERRGWGGGVSMDGLSDLLVFHVQGTEGRGIKEENSRDANRVEGDGGSN